MAQKAEELALGMVSSIAEKKTLIRQCLPNVDALN